MVPEQLTPQSIRLKFLQNQRTAAQHVSTSTVVPQATLCQTLNCAVGTVQEQRDRVLSIRPQDVDRLHHDHQLQAGLLQHLLFKLCDISAMAQLQLTASWMAAKLSYMFQNKQRLTFHLPS